MKKPVLLLLLALQALATAAFAAGSSTGALARIKSSGAIDVAYSPDSLPFSFDDKGEPAGYSIDICKRVIVQIGHAVGNAGLKVHWIPASTPERLKMVASGKAALECGNTSQTLARLADVDFSNLIYLEVGGIVTRKDAGIQHLGDLGKRKVAVLEGTTTEAALRRALKARLVDAQVVTVAKAKDGVDMLRAGTADAYAGDRIKLLGLLVQEPDPAKYAFLADEISYEPYALAIPRNDSALRLEVNRALSQVYRSGEIVSIYKQWLGTLGEPPDLVKAMYLLYAIPD